MKGALKRANAYKKFPKSKQKKIPCARPRRNPIAAVPLIAAVFLRVFLPEKAKRRADRLIIMDAGRAFSESLKNEI